MKYAQGRIGRVFVLRLEEGEKLPDILEDFAKEQGIRNGVVFLLGGADRGSRLVVGPDESVSDRIVPLVHEMSGITEMVGLGTVFRDETGSPTVHLHMAAGREGNASVGCSRAGVLVWLVGEVVIIELEGLSALRRRDPRSGLSLLDFTEE
ncbi:PPC domain-containing DNA-binding protein [Thermodesulforhabdus norvegica]|uniref:Predicted DNA-binding protein with PD1-like DNA-binding motif n=1 Tax=Thermodesulforhabdus norvegica TaxID=39841 RepID=A0A1I4QPJ0_9BACT|nr:PPC domain-containing DNA-binding protein [Thermodesulforhabdus norvegica]SFM41603.1 Predicted DNA-binding protein with PD1-like DNA-binding motif [Thermodesulforhabdus norvegica]